MKIKTLDDFMTKYNFSSSKLSDVIGEVCEKSISRRTISLWRRGVVLPREKNIVELQKIVDIYLSETDAHDFFPKK